MALLSEPSISAIGDRIPARVVGFSSSSSDERRRLACLGRRPTVWRLFSRVGIFVKHECLGACARKMRTWM
ncbi:hypothetical protein PanWU01x14_287440, partial [Parasponia andersonii]